MNKIIERRLALEVEMTDFAHDQRSPSLAGPALQWTGPGPEKMGLKARVEMQRARRKESRGGRKRTMLVAAKRRGGRRQIGCCGCCGRHCREDEREFRHESLTRES
eukprot:513987-Hanusia_phi.AAC.5